jgi:ParB family chromosome partitioning protein
MVVAAKKSASGKGPAKKPSSKKTSPVGASKKASVDGRLTRFIPLDEIRPDESQPRRTFHPVDGVVPKEALEALRELADNIHALGGLIQPISVRVADDGVGYVITEGERRWRAYLINRDLGRPNSDKIECFVREDISEAIRKLGQLAENIQRESLSDIDIAVYLKAVMEEFPELQQKDLADLLNKDPRWISRILGLLDARYAEVVMNGHIVYSAVLEQFKALPQESQTKLHAQARQSGTKITTHQIRQAKNAAMPPKIPEVTGVEALEKLGIAGVGGSRGNSELLSSVESALMSGAVDGEKYVPGGAPPGRQELRLRFSQALTLANFLVMDDEQVSLQLENVDMRAVIKRMGGKAPADDLSLGPVLMELLVNAGKKARK